MRCDFWASFKLAPLQALALVTSPRVGLRHKAWMAAIFWDKWVPHFIEFVYVHEGNLCPTNYHLLVLDGHNSHLTIDVVHKQKGGVGFNNFTITHKSCFVSS
jgi:hypothetical protein